MSEYPVCECRAPIDSGCTSQKLRSARCDSPAVSMRLEFHREKSQLRCYCWRIYWSDRIAELMVRVQKVVQHLQRLEARPGEIACDLNDCTLQGGIDAAELHELSANYFASKRNDTICPCSLKNGANLVRYANIGLTHKFVRMFNYSFDIRMLILAE